MHLCFSQNFMSVYVTKSHVAFSRAAEILEHEKLLAAGSMSDITPHDLLQPHSDLLQPHSDLYIRNRFLSRIGASVSTIEYFLRQKLFSSLSKRAMDLFFPCCAQ